VSAPQSSFDAIESRLSQHYAALTKLLAPGVLT
jgi:hypothetical protein